MACTRGCGGSKTREAELARLSLIKDQRPPPSGVYSLSDDTETCAPYHGQFPGTSVWIVGWGTPHEKLFVHKARRKAEEYASQHQVTMMRRSVRQLCHDSIVALLGA